jgi:hypothetical protein
VQPTPREIRQTAGVSQLQVAARAKKSLPVVRLYEADPEAVSASSRRALEPVYAALRDGHHEPSTGSAA